MGRYLILFLALLGLCYLPIVQDGGLVPRQLLLGAGAAVGYLFLPNTSRGKLTLAWPEWAFLTLLAWQATSLLWSVNVAEAWVVIGRWAALGSWYFLLRAAFSTGTLTLGQVAVAFIAYFLADAAYALYDIVPLATKGQLFSDIQQVRGSHGNKNLLSASLGLTLPWLVYGLLKDGRRKVLYGVSLGVAVLLIGLFQTRAAWVGVAAGAGLAALLYLTRQASNRQQRVLWLAVIGGLVGVGGLALSYFGLSERLARTESIQERFALWDSSWQMLQEALVWGKGIGQWQIWMPAYGLEDYNWKVQRGWVTFQRPHNDWLWIVCELGLIGLALFLAFFGGAMARLWKAQKAEPLAARLGLAALAGYAILSTFDFPRERPELQWLWLIWAAWAFGQAAWAARPVQPEPMTSPKKRKSEAVKMEEPSLPQKGVPVAALVISLALLAVCHGLPRLQAERAVQPFKQAVQAGMLPDATRLYAKARSGVLSVDATSVPLAWYMAVVTYQHHGFEQALGLYREAQALAPYSIHTFNNLGTTYAKLGKPDSALANYRRCLHLAPHWDEPLINISALELDQPGGGTKAFGHMREVLDTVLDPRWAVYRQLTLKAYLTEARAAESPAHQAAIDSLLTDRDFPARAYALYKAKKRSALFWR